MVSNQARNMYRQTQASANINPVKLIDMMYERVLLHLDLAIDGVVRKDAKLRGENLSKAIALITELSASVKEDDQTDAATFLRGLYSAILVALPTASASNNQAMLVQARKYIAELRRIWGETAMLEAGFSGTDGGSGAKAPSRSSDCHQQAVEEPDKQVSAPLYGAKPSKSDVVQQRLSVSI